ncbi:hypothetical protein CAC42_7773 [Sphaceloma murrayae]|uniref:JmjC domain-containing protein n=1 Tax=Sphaceloma murrayae TaxID=2082308 RepID=A0A2K1QXM6_9PEZI|nr:hypothetical protein CAC42_7773 [Sphaceloma murrayae]
MCFAQPMLRTGARPPSFSCIPAALSLCYMRGLATGFRSAARLYKQAHFVVASSRSQKAFLHAVRRLPDGEVSTFRALAFGPQVPAVLPSGKFDSIPAISRWFTRAADGFQRTVLNTDYLDQFSTAIVPLELTAEGKFARIDQPLSLLLESSKGLQNTHVYLAQASLSELPQKLQQDVPTPDLVLTAGKGDIYDTSLWIGLAPTYTPLHRDPNPNLFVQLAGKKIVRLFNPGIGRLVFAHVQAKIGGHASATMRGEEMMQGTERVALEEAVWGDAQSRPWMNDAMECEVAAGDGLFIPKGWWHSIKGVGDCMTGSVSTIPNTFTSYAKQRRSTGGLDDFISSYLAMLAWTLPKYVLRLTSSPVLDFVRIVWPGFDSAQTTKVVSFKNLCGGGGGGGGGDARC